MGAAYLTPTRLFQWDSSSSSSNRGGSARGGERGLTADSLLAANVLTQSAVALVAGAAEGSIAVAGGSRGGGGSEDQMVDQQQNSSRTAQHMTWLEQFYLRRARIREGSRACGEMCPLRRSRRSNRPLIPHDALGVPPTDRARSACCSVAPTTHYRSIRDHWDETMTIRARDSNLRASIAR